MKKGRQFEERYSKTSERKTSLKGKDWGEALAQYALQNRRNPVTNAERPFLQQIWPALRALGSNYDFHKATYTFDLQSFQPKHR